MYKVEDLKGMGELITTIVLTVPLGGSGYSARREASGSMLVLVHN